MSVDLEAVTDPAAETAYRAQLAIEAHRDGYAEGFSHGAVAAIEAYKAAQHGIVGDAELEARRWTVRGEPRTRETFGEPHPDDFKGREGAA